MGSWEDPHKRKRFQPRSKRSENFGTPFSQSSVVVQVNHIYPGEILNSLKESTTTLYRLWDNEIINPDFVQASTPKNVFGFAWILWAVPSGVEGARSPSYPRGYATANNVRINFSNISDLDKRILSRNTNFNNFLTNFHLMQKHNWFSLRNHCMLALQNPKTREGLSSHLRSSLSDANAPDLSYPISIYKLISRNNFLQRKIHNCYY